MFETTHQIFTLSEIKARKRGQSQGWVEFMDTVEVKIVVRY